MALLCARELLEYVISINDFCKTNNLNSQTLYSMSLTTPSALIKMTALFSATKDEINRANFKSDEARNRALEKLEESENLIIARFIKRADASGHGVLIDDIHIERLHHIADTLEEKDVQPIILASRSDMMSSTENLISEVKEWDIPIYAKGALLLKLDYMQRIIQKSSSGSAVDIRKDVLDIIGSFSVEFKQYDKKYNSKSERLIEWGKNLFSGGSMVLGLASKGSDVLSLTSDVMKLLPKE